MERSMTIGEKMYVRYGCGLCAPAGWLNFDSSPTLRVEKMHGIDRFIKKNGRKFPDNVRYGDIVRGLGLPDNFAHGVYASHVLEHLALKEFKIALNNTFKLLKPGSIFRLVVPDLEWRARQYVTSLAEGDVGAASAFMKSCHLGRESSPRSLISKLSLLFGGSAHLWMWDEFSMRDALVKAGFDHVRRCDFGDSGDPMFDLVEDHGRFFDEGFPELAFEAKKPAHFKRFPCLTA
jgi:Methyltransferase domain